MTGNALEGTLACLCGLYAGIGNRYCSLLVGRIVLILRRNTVQKNPVNVLFPFSLSDDDDVRLQLAIHNASLFELLPSSLCRPLQKPSVNTQIALRQTI